MLLTEPSTPTAGERPAYARDTYWRRYQPFLPARARLTDTSAVREEWWNWRGADIHLDRYEAEGAPATVIVLHGGGGYGRLMSPFALALNNHGYNVVAPDLPGFGLSRVPAEMVTYHHWIACAADLVDEIVGETGRPVVLFGMSLGGYLGYQAAARSGLAAGVIATTLADPRLPAVKEEFARWKMLGRLGVPLLPLFDALAGGMHLPIKWFARMGQIANNPELVALMKGDPYGGGRRVPLRFMRSLFDMQPVLEPEEFDICPVVLTQPAADCWTTLAASRPFFNRLKGPKKLVSLEGCGHYPIEEPGFSRLEEAALSLLRTVSRPRARIWGPHVRTVSRGALSRTG